MKELKKIDKGKMRSWLLDVASHFNLGNRGNDGRHCIMLNTEGFKCAVGMLCPTYIIDVNQLHDAQIKDMINVYPEGYEGLYETEFIQGRSGPFYKFSFMSRVQALHDNADNWDEHGITQDGLYKLGHICEDYRILAITKEEIKNHHYEPID